MIISVRKRPICDGAFFLRGVVMKRWHLESIVSTPGNRRSKRLAIPDWRSEGLFSGKRRIDFRKESRLTGLRRRLAAFLRRSV